MLQYDNNVTPSFKRKKSCLRETLNWKGNWGLNNSFLTPEVLCTHQGDIYTFSASFFSLFIALNCFILRKARLLRGLSDTSPPSLSHWCSGSENQNTFRYYYCDVGLTNRYTWTLGKKVEDWMFFFILIQYLRYHIHDVSSERNILLIMDEQKNNSYLLSTGPRELIKRE